MVEGGVDGNAEEESHVELNSSDFDEQEEDYSGEDEYDSYEERMMEGTRFSIGNPDESDWEPTYEESDREFSLFGDADEDDVEGNDEFEIAISGTNDNREGTSGANPKRGAHRKKKTMKLKMRKEQKTAEKKDKGAKFVVEEETIPLVESEYEDSQELKSLDGSSDDEADSGTYPQFDEEKHMKFPEFRVGLEFTNHHVFREALRYDSVRKGYLYKFKKNEKSRITAVCPKASDGCKWRIHASWDRDMTVFQIKSYNDEHIGCKAFKKNMHSDSSFLARMYIDVIRDDPKITPDVLIRTVKRDTGLDISKWQAIRMKRKAKGVIHGKYGEQYHCIRAYCQNVLETNPGSLCKLMVARTTPESAPFFERIFVCLKSQIDGFKAGCRPIIGLDGCHLKHEAGGVLLSAIGRDGNNQLYPVAWAVVEIECKSSWSWFMYYLLEALDNDPTLTFISDQQKV